MCLFIPFLSFIRRPFHFFGKIFHFLFLYLCFPYFGAFLFHMVISVKGSFNLLFLMYLVLRKCMWIHPSSLHSNFHEFHWNHAPVHYEGSVISCNCCNGQIWSQKCYRISTVGIWHWCRARWCLSCTWFNFQFI